VPGSWVDQFGLFLKDVTGCPGGCRVFMLKDTIKGDILYIYRQIGHLFFFVIWTA
jgi:hypothetical protein